MPILIYGLNHRTAELDLRGKLAFGNDELPTAVEELCSLPDVHEAAILSTCNRTEVHVHAATEVGETLSNWLATNRQVPDQEVKHATYTKHDLAAVSHAIRVASGLDSQIVGEAQIQGQFKDAYRIAREAQTLGPELGLLEEFTLQTAKRIRTQTATNSEPVSVAYAAMSMARQIFADFSHIKILLIGAGSNIRLISRYLQDEGSQNFTVANRTRANGESLAQSLQGNVIALDEIEQSLHEFDIVVSSTNSPAPLVTTAMLHEASRKRRYRPMFVADLSVPRDVEATADTIPDVYLHSIDDLSKIIPHDAINQNGSVGIADQIIEEGLACYEQKKRIQLSADLLSRYRAQVEAAREGSLEKALKRLNTGDDATEVLRKLAHDLANQIAHKPTLSIRAASTMANSELLHLLKRIYDLDN